MVTVIAILAILGIILLGASNIFLIFIIYRLHLLAKSRDVAEYKYAVNDPESKQEDPIISEVEAF